MLCFIRGVLAICLLCRSISIASCMEIEQDTKKLVSNFLKRVEFRPTSAELEKKAIENTKGIGTSNQLPDKEMLSKEIDKLSTEYSSRVEEIFKVSYLHPGFKDFHGFFDTQLKKIAENTKGNQLLQTAVILFDLIDKINTAFQNETTAVSPIKLAVSFGEGASLFSGKGDSLSELKLAINLNLIGDNTFYHKKLELCTFVPCLSSVESHPVIEKDIVHIRSCADPFWLLVAHESIHMTHFMLDRINDFFYKHVFGTLTAENIPFKISEISEKLQQLQDPLGKTPQIRLDVVDAILKTKSGDEDSIVKLYEFFKNLKRYHVKYKENLAMSARQFVSALPEMAKLFPEVEIPARRNMLDLCDKLEERETVIGADISELTLRLAAGLPIRYIYQNAHSSSYEYLDIICKVIEQTEIGKGFKTSDKLSKYVKSYINNESNDLYFNSRFFIQQIDYRLLSGPMFEDFKLTDVMPSEQLFEESAVKELRPNPRRIFPGMRRLIKNVINSFEEKNISETIKYLTINGNGQTIKKDFSLILQGSSNDSERIVSELKEYLKTVTNGQYELSKIEPLINLLKNIR